MNLVPKSTQQNCASIQQKCGAQDINRYTENPNWKVRTVQNRPFFSTCDFHPELIRLSFPRQSLFVVLKELFPHHRKLQYFSLVCFSSKRRIRFIFCPLEYPYWQNFNRRLAENPWARWIFYRAKGHWESVGLTFWLSRPIAAQWISPSQIIIISTITSIA